MVNYRQFVVARTLRDLKKSILQSNFSHTGKIDSNPVALVKVLKI